MSKRITLYGHASCPQVVPVKGVFKAAGIDYDYVNIHADPEAAAIVREINDGFESVPTVVFPDGSTLTEPTNRQLSQKLKEMGYSLGPAAWVSGYLWLIILLLGVIFALMRGFGLF